MQTTKKLTVQDFLPPLWISTLIVTGVLLWILSSLRELCFFLLLSYLISYLIHPAVTWLERHRISRAMGCVIVGCVILLGGALTLLSILPYLLGELSRLMTRLPSSVAQAENILVDTLKGLPFVGHLAWDELITRSRISGFVKEKLLNPETVATVGRALGSALLQGYSLGITILNLILLPFFVFYLTIDYLGLHQRAVLFVPIKQRKYVTALAHRIDDSVREFIKGQLIVGGILACLYMVGLGLIQLELAAAISIIAGFGNLVPYLGGAVGIVLASLVSLSSHSSLSHLLMVFLVFGLVQTCESFLITPKIVGDKVGISPLTVTIALIAGGTLFGLLGIMLAVPATAALKILAWEVLVLVRADITRKGELS